MKPFYTRDGVKITPGMTIYCKGEVYPEPPIAYIVKAISEDGKKVLFRDVALTDYTGARVDGIFSTAEACIEAVAKTRVKLDLTADDAHLIIFALARELKRIKADLEVLKIAKERDLTHAERCMLPNLGFQPTQEHIAEQIDPWISLVDDYNYLIDTIENNFDTIENNRVKNETAN